MLRDRGTIKWTAMMLTEQVELLREWYDDDDKSPKPNLNEWNLEQIQEDLNVAYKRKCQIEITIWQKGYYVSHVGVIEKIDVAAGQLVLVNSNNKIKINVNDVTKINCID